MQIIRYFSSGKTFTLKGKAESERGLIIRTVQDLFSLIELAKEGKNPNKYQVSISIYHISRERIVDLLEPMNPKKEPLETRLIQDSSTLEREIKGLSEHSLKSAMAINGYIERSETLRKMQCAEEEDKELCLKTHYIVLIKLYEVEKNSRKLLSQMQFVELASSEQQHFNEQNEIVAKILSDNFSNLAIRLLKHSLSEISESRDQLQRCLDLSMKPNCPLLLICCIDPNREKFDYNSEAVAYAAKIRACILSAFQKDEDDFYNRNANTVPIREDALIKDEKYNDAIMLIKDNQNSRSISNKRSTEPNLAPFNDLKNSSTEPRMLRERTFDAPKLSLPVQDRLTTDLTGEIRGSKSQTLGIRSSPEEQKFEEDLYKVKQQIAERERETEIRQSYRKSNEFRVENGTLLEPNIIEPEIALNNDKETLGLPPEIPENFQNMPFAQNPDYAQPKYSQRGSPEFSKLQSENNIPKPVFSEDAQKIMEKYYGDSKKAESENEEDIIENVKKLENNQENDDLKSKLEKMEEKSKDMAKSLKIYLKGTQDDQAVTMQKFEQVYEEMRTQYENYISDLENKLQIAEQNFAQLEKTKNAEIEEQAKEFKKKVKTKDAEFADLADQVNDFQGKIQAMERDLEESRNDNIKLIEEIKRLQNERNEKYVDSNELKKKDKEIEKLMHELDEMKEIVKEKKKESLKNEQTIKDLNKEISEIRKLADQGNNELNEKNDEELKLKQIIDENKKLMSDMKQKLEKTKLSKVFLFSFEK